MHLVALLSRWQGVREDPVAIGSSTHHILDRRAFEECYDFLTTHTLGICKIPGCGEKHHARGWCSEHYARWYRHGNPLYPKARRMSPFTECTVPGCEYDHHGHGLCISHLDRLRNRGELTDRNGNLLIREYSKRSKIE